MLVRLPVAPWCKVSDRVAGAPDGAVAEMAARVRAACRDVQWGAVLAVASLLAAGAAGMWAVLSVAAHLSAAA